MNILGLNAFHGDSSACLVVDGIVINAIEEERIRRIKHWAGLPTESIKWCLKNANIEISSVDYIAISRNPSANLYKKILRLLLKSPDISFLKNRLLNVKKITDVKADIAQLFGISPLNIKAKIENIEHHKAHIGSSFLVSPFEHALCISVDGFGDFLSLMRGVGYKNDVKIIDFVEFPHSLGVFYSAMTQFMGFLNYGDEYKLMGLSAYGKPAYVDKLRKVINPTKNGLFQIDISYFRHASEGVEMVWNNGQPTFGILFSEKFVSEFGEPRKKEEEISDCHQDFAASIQSLYEEIFFHILNDSYDKTKIDCLALSGGCIQNSLANGKITKNTPFKNIYIPPASYDAGTAIGAAMEVWLRESKLPRKFIMDNPYLGPGFNRANIELEINSFQVELKKAHCFIENITDDTLYKKVAAFIAEGKIVGWFQGRTEFGPRALGNRSILVDPRRKQMKEILNERIKRREWFRPFAPSVIEERASEWFEYEGPSPFMERVYKIKKDKIGLIPAVCHVDGTGRLQTVSAKTNERYYGLIREFENITGIPIVLNTSFNDNEPIVNTPRDALLCFLNTKIDVLVLGDYIISKNGK